MAFRLKRTCTVSPDSSRDYEPGRLHHIGEGTVLEDIPRSELEQLSPEHFVDDGGSDALPGDWRTNEATLAHDRRQAKANAADAKDRAKRKAARNREV